jgi:hypothetical protein
VNGIPTSQRRSFRRLSQRLRDVGLTKKFVETALLPEWWDSADKDDPAQLSQVEFAVARFLRMPLESVQDPRCPLELPPVSAQLRRSQRNAERDLSPAIASAIAIAGAATRNLKDVPEYSPIPKNPVDWRAQIIEGRKAVTVQGIVSDLWGHGIPVLQIATLPRPAFRGLACMVEQRPVILLGTTTYYEPSLLIDLAHEGGHIALGHVTPETPTLDVAIDAEESELEPDYEKEAISYCYRALGGENGHFQVRSLANSSVNDPLHLARLANLKGNDLGIDSGLLVLFWQFETGRQSWANAAVRKLGKLRGRKIIAEFTEKHIDIDCAPETDASLLRCLKSFDAGDADSG